MSNCDLCDEYAEKVIPVSIHSKVYVWLHKVDDKEGFDWGIWNKLRLLEMEKRSWDDRHLYLCEKCFNENELYIGWFG